MEMSQITIANHNCAMFCTSRWVQNKGANEIWGSHNSEAKNSSLLGCDTVSLGVQQSTLTAWPWRWAHYGLPQHQELCTQWHSVTSQEAWIFRGGTHSNEQILNRELIAPCSGQSVFVTNACTGHYNATHIYIERLTQGAVHCTVCFTTWLRLAAVATVPTRSTLDLLTMWWSWSHCKSHHGALHLSH
jgi:hypothetical protein